MLYVKTDHNVIHYNRHIVIHDILLKMVFNTNKTGHHVMHYNRHIVELGIKHQ